MNTEEEFLDSDDSDEDYVPDSKIEDAVSELESDGDPEDHGSGSEDETNKKGKKRPWPKKAKKEKKKKAKATEEKAYGADANPDATEITKDQKQKADDLWADFMKDTGFISKNNKSTTSSLPQTTKKAIQTSSGTNKTELEPQKTANTVKITQIFEFAGEEVKVDKEVDSNSAEARLLSTGSAKKKTAASNLNGLGNVLSQLGKKQKISTLEKTKLDWEKFKKEENIEEELETHNKGKDGYLDRQDFLQRADVRRFEIEKEIRNVERAKRFNNPI